jgi:hypothetical protein
LGLRCFTGNQFIEVALLSFRSPLLVEQCETILVERPEPFVPRYFFQRTFAAESREVEANHADIAVSAGSPHARWRSSALFCPLPNLVVIGCYI